MKGDIKNSSIGFYEISSENPVLSNIIEYQNLNKVYNIPNNNYITNINNIKNIQNPYYQNFLLSNYQNVGIVNNLLNFQNISQLPISTNLNNMAYLSELNRIINYQNENANNFIGTNAISNHTFKKNDQGGLSGVIHETLKTNTKSSEKITEFENEALMQERREDDGLNSSQSSSEKQKYFKCHFKGCDKIFHKESSLNDHRKCHTKEKPHKCDFPNCLKTFSQLGNLRKHQIVHTGRKIYKCEHPSCGKSFSALYNLKVNTFFFKFIDSP